MDHPNLKEIEAERKAVFAKLTAAQDGLSKDGCYLQCLLTPDAQTDGVKPVVFNRNRQAGDESKNWTAVLGAVDVEKGVLCQYAVNRYDGPLGSGFILRCVVRDVKIVWRYEEHHGPEEREDGRWVEVIQHGQ